MPQSPKLSVAAPAPSRRYDRTYDALEPAATVYGGGHGVSAKNGGGGLCSHVFLEYLDWMKTSHSVSRRWLRWSVLTLFLREMSEADFASDCIFNSLTLIFYFKLKSLIIVIFINYAFTSIKVIN
jgi:hypothetical protein